MNRGLERWLSGYDLQRTWDQVLVLTWQLIIGTLVSEDLTPASGLLRYCKYMAHNIHAGKILIN